VTLRVIYRSTGRENRKSRPAFYSKLLSLASFLRAAEECEEPVDILFLNDGPIPDDRLELMHAGGEVGYLRHTDLSRRLLHRDQVGGIGLVRSYLATIAAVDSRGWPDTDIAYLVEDDYLHLPVALKTLVAAADAIPQGAYFGLHATIDWPRSRSLPVVIDGNNWRTASSATGTFAARIGALRDDRWIHRLGWFAGMTPDMDMAHAYQGIQPFRWSAVLGDLFGNAPGHPGSVLGRIKRAGVQSAMNLLAIRASLRRHLLVAPVKPAATHVETHYLAPGVDWEEVAEDTRRWAGGRGVRVRDWHGTLGWAFLVSMNAV
jgi:hypothetical protein